MSRAENKMFSIAGDYSRNVHLDWLEDYTPIAMAEAFKVSADRVIEACTEDKRHPDRFFYPVAYLYRHYLELTFKNLIHFGMRLRPPIAAGTKGLGHDLAALWKGAQGVLAIVFSGDDPSVLGVVNNAVDEFGVLDPDGQSFRYYTDPRGNRNLQKAPRVISLEHLRQRMEEVFRILEACLMGVSEFVESQDGNEP